MSETHEGGPRLTIRQYNILLQAALNGRITVGGKTAGLVNRLELYGLIIVAKVTKHGRKGRHLNFHITPTARAAEYLRTNHGPARPPAR